MSNDQPNVDARKRVHALLLSDRIDTANLERDHIVSNTPLAYRVGRLDAAGCANSSRSRASIAASTASLVVKQVMTGWPGCCASRCYDAVMTKVRTTLTVDAEVLRAVKVRAARTGKGDSEVIEEALRRDLGLDLLERLWDRNQLSEEAAMALAVESQHAIRQRPRSR